MIMDDNKHEQIVKTLIPGFVAILLYMFILSPTVFFSWFNKKIILYLIFFFLTVPIAKMLIAWKFEKNQLIPMVLGVVFLIPVSIYMHLTFIDIFRSVLEVVIIISLLITAFGGLKNKII